MTKTHLVIPDQHAHPDYPNQRADWVGKLIKDVKPDVVVNMGDAADMASLCSYEKGKSSFVGRSYEKDINSHLEFQDRLWLPFRRSKRKLPHRIVLEGNHEHRIKKALSTDPELEGERYGISFKDLDFDSYYDEVVEYHGGTPGISDIDGISYAHYFISGVMGRPMSGIHHAYSLLQKNHKSCTCAHTHLIDWRVETKLDGTKMMGLVAGVYQDYSSDWAGDANRLWTSGVWIKRNVENGMYDPEFVSIERLQREYGA